MSNPFIRTEMLIGSEKLNKLKKARIALFGLGGVGGHAGEALVRSGVGHIALIDGDTVSESNLNRQLIATTKTLGMAKTDAAANRFRDINPDISLSLYNMFYLPGNADLIDLSGFDYVIDAIDTVSAKLEIISRCKSLGVPVISSMGTGNKLDPSELTVTDIYKTSLCPLARVMRQECRRRGIVSLKVVYSTEPPVEPDRELSEGLDEEDGKRKKLPPASNSFVPATAGLLIASEVIKDLIERT